MMRWGVVGLCIGLLACSEGDVVEPVERPPPTGGITGAVSSEGMGVPGVRVHLSGSLAQSTATGGAGSYLFTGVPIGTHVITVDGYGDDLTFSRTQASISVVPGDLDHVVDFAGEYVRTSSIIGIVEAIGVRGSTIEVVEDVIVHMAGTETETDTTDANGRYFFEGLRRGTYDLKMIVPEDYLFAEPDVRITIAHGERAYHRFLGAVDQDLFIATDSLPYGHVGSEYRFQFLAVGGGPGSSWQVRDGTELPQGLTLLESGVLSGIPSQVGVTPVGIVVVTADGESADEDYAFRVCGPAVDLNVGGYAVHGSADVRGPCGLFIRPNNAAYYRVVMVDTDAFSESVYDVELTIAGTGEGAQGVPVVASGGVGPRFQARETHLGLRRAEEAGIRRLLAEGKLDLQRGRSELLFQTRASAPPDSLGFTIASRPMDLLSCVGQDVVAHVVGFNDYIAVYDYSAFGMEDEVQKLLDYYDQYGAQVIQGYFGGVSDIDNNGRIVVLLRPDHEMGNALGFVWSGDLFGVKSECSTASEMELIHYNVVSLQDFRNGYYGGTGTLVHEAFHISSLYKSIRRWERNNLEGQAIQPLWIEEGRAENAAEIAARIAWEAAGGPGYTDEVGGGDLQDALGTSVSDERYAYAVHSIISPLNRLLGVFPGELTAITEDHEGSGGGVYGTGWLFHRFLRDYYAVESAADKRLLSALTDSLTAAGVSGLEDVTGHSIEDLFTDHAVAIALSGSEQYLSEYAPYFRTYDYVSLMETSVANPPGIWPWPRTISTESGQTTMYVQPGGEGVTTVTGRIAASGIRFHDFRLTGPQGYTFRATIPSSTRLIVARIIRPVIERQP